MLKYMLIICLIMIPSQAQSNDCVNGDVHDSLLGNYLNPYILETDVHEWSPSHGHFLVRRNNVLEIVFRFDSNAINILKSREDMALEIDIVDKDNILSENWAFSDNLPDDMTVRKDVAFLDKYHQLSIIAVGTQHFKVDTNYVIKFGLGSPIQHRGRLKLNIDLSVKFERSFNELPFCPNPFYRPNDITSGWNYFTLEIEEYPAFWYNLEPNYGICWSNQNNSSVCSVGDIAYGPEPPTISNEGNPSESTTQANIFTDGYHTHIIHPDYRCSDNQCWKSGGDTNCYDGYTHFEIRNGDINDIIRYRNKYEMCAEVYNSGTNNPNTQPGDSEPDIDDADSDLHIERFRIKENGTSGYGHSLEKTLGWGQSFYVRGELEICNQSSQKAKDIDSDYRIEDNRDFDKHDTKVDEDGEFDLSAHKCTDKGMSPILVQVSSDGNSVKVSGKNSRTFPISNNFRKIYFFADVEEKGRENGDHDISSHDHDEYGVLKLTIQDPPVVANFHTSVTVGDAPLSVSFTDATTGPVDNRVWYFGDGIISHEANPVHTYAGVGVYTVTLVTSNYSHKTLKKRIITVNEPVPLDTDGDGIPDDSEQGDIDGDGMPDYQESWFVDSDNDGVNDQLDSQNHYRYNDSDSDGRSNYGEKADGTDPLDPNSVLPEDQRMTGPPPVQGFQLE